MTLALIIFRTTVLHVVMLKTIFLSLLFIMSQFSLSGNRFFSQKQEIFSKKREKYRKKQQKALYFSQKNKAECKIPQLLSSFDKIQKRRGRSIQQHMFSRKLSAKTGKTNAFMVSFLP